MATLKSLEKQIAEIRASQTTGIERDRAAKAGARDVALALVVRDLISTEDYDTLTLPWRQTIGPIHPDDKELSR